MTEKPKKAKELATVDKTRISKVEIVEGVLTVTSHQEASERLTKAFGNIGEYAISRLMGQVFDLLPAPSDDNYTPALNAAVDMMEAFAPEDAGRAMLAVQMIAAHMLGMDATRRALKGERVDFRNVHASIATKAQRTFLAQMEGMAKLRRNGEQVVRHVHVGSGAQAIIANTFNHGGGGR